MLWASSVGRSTALVSAGVVRNGSLPKVPCCLEFKQWNRTYDPSLICFSATRG